MQTFLLLGVLCSIIILSHASRSSRIANAFVRMKSRGDLTDDYQDLDEQVSRLILKIRRSDSLQSVYDIVNTVNCALGY